MGGQYPGQQQQQPQYSPDGRWWWDGQTWQPVVSPQATRIVQRMILFRVIGCGVSVLFMLGIALFVGKVLLDALRH